MNPISTVIDAIIAASAIALQNTVRPMEILPGAMSLSVLKTIAAQAPATRVAFLGGRALIDGADFVQTSAVFCVYVITDQAQGGDARNRGDARQIGAYDIINLLIPALHGMNVATIGILSFKRVENLFTVEIDKQGVAIYALTFELPMQFEYQIDETTLNAFTTYSADHSMAPGPNEPPASDLVTLP